MKVVVKDAVRSFEALRNLSGIKFPAKLSYKLSRIVTGIEQELNRYESLRVNLVKEYGKEDENKNISVTPTDENWEKFVAELEELQKVEMEIWGDRIRIDELGEKEISPADLSLLSWLIEDESRQSPKLELVQNA